MIRQTAAWPEAVPLVMPVRRPTPPNGFVVLDRAWAERLGVQRVGGVYRIRRRDLVERLAAQQREQTDGPGSPIRRLQERAAIRVAG
jgi:hypothetical protein